MKIYKIADARNSMDTKEVNILGIPFRVNYIENTAFIDCQMGLMDTKNCIIHLSSNMPEIITQQTLMHEIFHSIDDLLAIGLNEQQITAISQGFFQVLKANPNIFV